MQANICRSLLSFGFLLLLAQYPQPAQAAPNELCPRPAAGSDVPEPQSIHSEHGVLKVSLRFAADADSHARIRYCYLAEDGAQAPTLHVNPGDEVVLALKNEIAPGPLRKTPPRNMDMVMARDSCAAGQMAATSTNLHFHGLQIPPACHGDDVLHTIVGPSAPPFEYHFKIPENQPPGLYWYHPHLHGFTRAQILGGASGALIVEGIERANPQLAGLPERVLIIRDQELANPDAEPSAGSAAHDAVLRDAEGDILNTGTDGGKPAKDLSLNFVPVAYPDYQPARIRMRPSAREFWRVLNASGITYADIEVNYAGKPELLGVVALDGVPLSQNGANGRSIVWKSHILIPPAGRAEFILNGPPTGVTATLTTRHVDTGPAGENDPTRPLATLIATPDAPEPPVPRAAAAPPLKTENPADLRVVAPARVRKLYFSEEPQNPSDPKSPTVFFITVEGQAPKAFDPASSVPNIIARQGDVEDWIIENRTRELHAFHIHQIHFMLIDWNGVPIDEPFLRDTINVAYWDGSSPSYPSVKLRMDFRDPNIVGDFVYHCHLAEHEDGGMMGMIRVVPSAPHP